MTPTETTTILRQFNSLAHRTRRKRRSGAATGSAAMDEAKKGD